MKKIIITYFMNLICKQNKYNEIKLQEIKYGLEAIYLNVSKFIVFFTINAFFGIFKESLLFLLFYVPLRSFSFGFHAKKSITCWILSAIAFIGFPYLATLISFSMITKILVIIYSIFIFYIYSPADTPNRPIIDKKYRLKIKTNTMIFVIIYSFLLFLAIDFASLIALALIYQSLMISPYFYKLFNLRYNNYLYYGLN
ncbi:MAG: accessory gene regulator B family protein [Bacilli bacterium]|nr:accessory gene regulator B family protein [Bacilli bacterium]